VRAGYSIPTRPLVAKASWRVLKTLRLRNRSRREAGLMD
jgi:hypothetical protein